MSFSTVVGGPPKFSLMIIVSHPTSPAQCHPTVGPPHSGEGEWLRIGIEVTHIGLGQTNVRGGSRIRVDAWVKMVRRYFSSE